MVPDCRIEPVSQGSPLSCAAPRTSSCYGDHRSCTSDVQASLHYSAVPRSLLSPVMICQCDQAYRNNGKTSYRAVRPSRDGCSAGVTVTTLNGSQVAANQASDRNSNNCRFGSQSIGTKPRMPARAGVNTARSIYPRQWRSCICDEFVTTNLQRFRSWIPVGEAGRPAKYPGYPKLVEVVRLNLLIIPRRSFHHRRLRRHPALRHVRYYLRLRRPALGPGPVARRPSSRRPP